MCDEKDLSKDAEVQAWLEKNGDKADAVETDKYSRQRRYHETHGTKNYSLQMMRHTEQDLIDWLEAQPNKSGYIKRLIREDMERQKGGE